MKISLRGGSRRSFLQQAMAVSSGFLGLKTFSETAGAAVKPASPPLVKDPRGVLNLRPGFSYHSFSTTGEAMDDGLRVPGRHDGMAAFPGPDQTTILIRNHEVEPGQPQYSPFGRKNHLLPKVDRRRLYDFGFGKKPGLGGTTTLIYDTRKRKLLKHFMSLAGTQRNCAGGPTPWNSWITCEESVVTASDEVEHDHGYNFEVPASTEIGLVLPTPLKAMGRFYHEAVAVDPRSGIVYQTEDRPDGLFYRFIPVQPGKLAAGGGLQALRVQGARSFDSRNWKKQTAVPGQSFSTEWVDIDEPEAPDDDLRYQGFYAKGATRFARAEGIWYGREAVYFACTTGGKKKKGQIWRYFPGTPAGNSKAAAGRLELFLEPNNTNLVENADNLTMAPWGDLIVCEDGASPQFVVGITPDGRFYRLAETTLSEFAGATFSPDGSTLFVNIQTPGITLAITGPWEWFSRGWV